MISKSSRKNGFDRGRVLGLLFVMVAAITLTGVAQAQAPAPEQGSFTIGPDDVLQIVVWGNAELSREVSVRPDGFISLPLLNDVRASGLTPMQLRDQIKSRLAEFVSAPEVFVVIADVRSFKVAVIGKVNNPGRFQLRGPTTVLEVLAQAGGLQEYADEDKIFVLRRLGTPVDRDTPSTTGRFYRRIPFNYKTVLKEGGESGNFAVAPNDVVVVP